MNKIEKSIVVDVPVSKAYATWSDFENFPRFMEGVKSISRQGSNELLWEVEVGGKDKQYIAEITDEVPNKMIAWKSTAGVMNEGMVTFLPEESDKCTITLTMSYEPEGLDESVGHILGIDSGRVEGDLERFKTYVESKATLVSEGDSSPPKEEVLAGMRHDNLLDKREDFL